MSNLTRIDANRVPASQGCPRCHETLVDSLVWQEDGRTVRCACGAIYAPPPAPPTLENILAQVDARFSHVDAVRGVLAASGATLDSLRASACGVRLTLPRGMGKKVCEPYRMVVAMALGLTFEQAYTVVRPTGHSLYKPDPIILDPSK